ncbi:hypothetical protein BBO99_00007336 [Phytophthora kernoviae]|uniref:Uncharacterized protein n=2 Tax=Phytophthora kernoviae TaxID=325452 RepID=A0A3R7JWT5_9STRA|nr:hypothetical protein G195_009542 [Phytophthora kernoviae 00238/432]KAG2519481.1 hypothetical protein JM16_007062 [Phytophthora kernoviae]KAG2520577.1 hypothetical protein JM18_006921 [Phytophthora kernoviae]RLN46115.1 hypothetical protein BBI17_007256 [Phytophthora kernoviae]RLN76714.1 hypothetical protein BBO99_00007336 [Phytophthora kernoviae]
MSAKKANVDSCAKIEQEWLDAGRRGDIKTMQSLRKTHPKWLALDRVVATQSSRERDSDGGSFCDWDRFHLPTVGASALHAAAWDGSYAVLEFLLKEGQKVDARGGQGVTVLMDTLLRHNVQALRAVFQGSAVVQLNTVVDCRKEDAERLGHTLSVVNLLLSHGADTEARDDEGKTALYLATNDELFEVAKLLVERGARLDAQDLAGRSPLHVCLQGSAGKSAQVTNLLISRGAPVDLSDKSGETPMVVAVRCGDTTAVQLLLNHPSHAAKQTKSKFAGTALLTAAELGVVPVVKFLLDESYTSVDITNARGETALHLAIMKLHKPLVQMLCELKSPGLLLETQTQDKGESVLHYAARYGAPQELQMVLSLFGKGATQEVNAANASGLTPLYLVTTARTAGSMIDRRAKIAHLEKHGASLFPNGAQLFREVKSTSDASLVSMNAAVKRCLALWVLESGAISLPSSTSLNDFCLSWVACVQRPQSDAKHGGAKQAAKNTKLPVQHQLPLSRTLAALVYAGYAEDAMPLLVVTPLKCEEIPRFLELLKALAATTKHAMLKKLQQELEEAWKRDTDDRSRKMTSSSMAKASGKGK